MKILKYLFTICLMVMCITNISYADKTKNIEPGLYELKNDVYHEQEIGQNMARTYLDENMKLEVLEDGKYNYTIGFSGTEYMDNHRIIVDGTSQDIEIVEENKDDFTIKIKFNVDSLDSKIKTKIYVDAMERDVEFDIIPDFESLNIIEKYEVKEAEEIKLEEIENSDREYSKQEDSDQEKTEASKEIKETDEKVSASSINKTPAIIVALVVVVTGIVLFIRKINAKKNK